RRQEREYALYAFTEGNLADGEIFIDDVTGAGDDNAFIGLNALALAFLDLYVNADGVARLKCREVLAFAQFRNFFSFKLLQQISHGFSPSFLRLTSLI